MTERYLEDLKVGDRFQSAPYTVTEEAIIRFATEFDPQPFHLDADVARKSLFKGLSASGWHTAAIAMRLYVTCGINFAGGSIGMGVDEMRWPTPVRPGDILTAEIEILDARASRSKPEHGIVQIRNVMTNQRGEVVLTWKASALVRRRMRG